MRRVFGFQETTYTNEWFGMLDARISLLLFRQPSKSNPVKAYESYQESHVRKIRLPFKLRGKGGITTIGPADHLIYTLASFLLLPLILMHKKSVFIAPPFFFSLISPILRLFRREVYLVVLDPQTPLQERVSKSKNPCLKAYGALSRAAEKVAAVSASKIFVVSDFLEESYSRYKQKVIRVAHGADAELIEAIKPIRRNRGFRVTYLGSFDEWRGMDTAVEAVRLLSKKGIKLNLTLIGKGSDFQRIKEMTEDDKNIEVTGYLPNEEAFGICKGSDLLILPAKDVPMSRTIGSIKIFEYMACGIPILATNTGEHARWIHEWDVGVVTEAGSRNIAAGIEKLVKNKKLYSILKRNAVASSSKVDFREMRDSFKEEIERFS